MKLWPSIHTGHMSGSLRAIDLEEWCYAVILLMSVSLKAKKSYQTDATLFHAC